MAINVKLIVYVVQENRVCTQVPSLSGCMVEGDSMGEMMANLKGAIEG